MNLANDRIVERICCRLRQPLKSLCINHLAETTEDNATARLLEFGKFELNFEDENWGRNFPPYWHCTVTKRRGIPWVLGAGDGETKRGAIIIALVHMETHEIEGTLPKL